MSKRIFFIVCAFLAVSASATTSDPQEAILGEWELTDGYCEHGSKVLPDGLQLPAGHHGGMIFHKDNTVEMVVKADLGNIGKICTLSMKTTYSINGDQLAMETSFKSAESLDCPEFNEAIKLYSQSSAKAYKKLDSSVEFKISPDGQILQTFSPGYGLCDNNGRNVAEYTKVQN